jgi:hypothetical protein
MPDPEYTRPLGRWKRSRDGADDRLKAEGVNGMRRHGGLAAELDWAQEQLFWNRDLPHGRREALIEQLLAAQVTEGADVGMFVAGEQVPVRLFTGEPIRTRLAAAHYLAQESARVLHRLGRGDAHVEVAVAGTVEALARSCYAARHCTIGECAISFVGYTRLLHEVSGERSMSEIAWRLRTLARHRLPTGRWKGFPFYYTVLMLLELGVVAAQTELCFALPAFQRVLVRPVEDPLVRKRRLRLLREAVRRCPSRGG